MATSKSTGASRLGRDAQPKYLGVKIGNGQFAKAGQILVLQRGTHFLPGKNVGMGGNNALFALKSGIAQYTQKTHIRFDRSRKTVKVINITLKQPK